MDEKKNVGKCKQAAAATDWSITKKEGRQNKHYIQTWQVKVRGEYEHIKLDVSYNGAIM